MAREAQVVRKTEETNVELYLNVDGDGRAQVDSGYPFLDHMLTLFSWHGFFNLTIKAQGDIQIDEHHLVEDVGICLGKTLSQALGNRNGIRRYGYSLIPMDEVLVQCAIDVSGRPVLVFEIESDRELKNRIEEIFKDFFRAFCVFSGITLHIRVLYGDGFHHILEGIFKSFAVSLDRATQIERRRKNVPSTKGHIEEV